jgi:hypothetical protein
VAFRFLFKLHAALSHLHIPWYHPHLTSFDKVVYSDDDCTNLLAQAVLDKKLREWGRADLFATFDWVSPNSFPLMVDPPSPFATAKAALPDFTNQVQVTLGLVWFDLLF